MIKVLRDAFLSLDLNDIPNKSKDKAKKDLNKKINMSCTLNHKDYIILH